MTRRPFGSFEDDTPSWKDVPTSQRLLLALAGLLILVSSCQW